MGQKPGDTTNYQIILSASTATQEPTSFNKQPIARAGAKERAQNNSTEISIIATISILSTCGLFFHRRSADPHHIPSTFTQHHGFPHHSFTIISFHQSCPVFQENTSRKHNLKRGFRMFAFKSGSIAAVSDSPTHPRQTKSVKFRSIR